MDDAEDEANDSEYSAHSVSGGPSFRSNQKIITEQPSRHKKATRKNGYSTSIPERQFVGASEKELNLPVMTRMRGRKSEHQDTLVSHMQEPGCAIARDNDLHRRKSKSMFCDRTSIPSSGKIQEKRIRELLNNGKKSFPDHADNPMQTKEFPLRYQTDRQTRESEQSREKENVNVTANEHIFKSKENMDKNRRRKASTEDRDRLYTIKSKSEPNLAAQEGKQEEGNKPANDGMSRNVSDHSENYQTTWTVDPTRNNFRDDSRETPKPSNTRNKAYRKRVEIQQKRTRELLQDGKESFRFHSYNSTQTKEFPVGYQTDRQTRESEQSRGKENVNVSANEQICKSKEDMDKNRRRKASTEDRDRLFTRKSKSEPNLAAQEGKQEEGNVRRRRRKEEEDGIMINNSTIYEKSENDGMSRNVSDHSENHQTTWTEEPTRNNFRDDSRETLKTSNTRNKANTKRIENRKSTTEFGSEDIDEKEITNMNVKVKSLLDEDPSQMCKMIFKEKNMLKKIIKISCNDQELLINVIALLEKALSSRFVQNAGYALIIVLKVSFFESAIVQFLTTYLAQDFLDWSQHSLRLSDNPDKAMQEVKEGIVELQTMKERQVSKIMTNSVTHRASRASLHENEEPPNNFREIEMYPQHAEIKTDKPPFFRMNKETGGLRPLREGIREYKKNIHMKKKKLQDLRLYYDVKIQQLASGRDGIYHQIQFNVSHLRHVEWDHSKRLLFGSFLCLSSDDFETMLFATVADRDPRKLRRGKVAVSFQTDFKDVMEMSTRTFVMAESVAFFEAYKHVLFGLQNIISLPFQKHLVNCEKDVDPPTYLCRKDSAL
ncbi:hypothetical protein CHS0354_015166 [Potamilus streckersoni]|uniref:ZNFX1 domain-containing protein n=1 Tax=Potamilus streckersoni TaxID=2493646 RepID=A0AAE0SD52_9BIVA|nr:hypothetical protein CHS0354_015166 [Potamilus streckersoni]